MPGDTFKYEFQLRQTGTYWYHSHTMLQEEIGVFGAVVIDEAADISHIAYSGFLMNGEERQEYPGFMPGERIRLRIINASASSNYWLTFGGDHLENSSLEEKTIIPFPLHRVRQLLRILT